MIKLKTSGASNSRLHTHTHTHTHTYIYIFFFCSARYQTQALHMTPTELHPQLILTFFFGLFLETKSCYAAQVGLNQDILLSLPRECWNFRYYHAMIRLQVFFFVVWGWNPGVQVCLASALLLKPCPSPFVFILLWRQGVTDFVRLISNAGSFFPCLLSSGIASASDAAMPGISFF
jgi:hypothetical protein